MAELNKQIVKFGELNFLGSNGKNGKSWCIQTPREDSKTGKGETCEIKDSGRIIKEH